jgi:hypothetical protein
MRTAELVNKRLIIKRLQFKNNYVEMTFFLNVGGETNKSLIIKPLWI